MLLEAFLTSLFISTFCYPVLDCRHEPLGVSGTLFFAWAPQKKRQQRLRECPAITIIIATIAVQESTGQSNHFRSH